MNMPWINSMPKRWTSLRAKNMFSKQSRPVREEDDVVTCFRDGTVTLRKNRRITGFTESIQWSGYQGVRKGDLVIHVMDAFAGAIGVSDSDGKSTPVYSVCTPKMDLNCHYYAYLLREMARTGFIQSLYRGIRERSSDFRFEVFSGLFLPLPPRDEQDRIVRYLDWKVSRINKLINVKRRQIELLRERKQSVISEAIPKSGEQTRFRTLFTLIKGLNITKANLVEIGIPCVSYGQIHSKYGFEVNPDIHTLPFVSESYLESNAKSLIHYGDFVFADTSEDLIGSGNFTYLNSHTPVFAGYHTIIARPLATLNYRYFAYYFDSPQYRSQIQKRVNGVKVYSITRTILNSTSVVVPSPDEQKRIVSMLDRLCASYARSIDKLAEQITLLAEYRTRLVSDVVTGKLDVRGVTVPKYEVVEDVDDDDNESLDEELTEDDEE